MIDSCFSFAGIPVLIGHQYSRIDREAEDYVSNREAEIRISLNTEDIQYEKERLIEQSGDKQAQRFSDGYFEFIAAQRKISEIFPLYNCATFHGSALSFDGEGIVFAANSGVGKSTHAELWRDVFKDRVVMINDDKPFIKIEEKAMVYGSPWNGKHHLSSNICRELKTICFLERGEDNHIVKASAKEAFSDLYRYIYHPQNAAAMEKTLKMIDDLSKKVSIYRLWCNMSTDAVYTAYNMIMEVSDETES